MIILILVADEQQSSAQYPGDHTCTQTSYLKLFRAIKRIIGVYGNPDAIFSTPYLSGRQTVSNVIKSCINIDTVYDPEIGKYNTNLKLDPDTEKLLPIIDTNIAEFKQRVTTRLDRLKKSSENKCIWILTHKCVIEEICRLSEIKYINMNCDSYIILY